VNVRIHWLSLVVALTVCGAPAATAQSTRAEEDRAKREARASKLIPEKRSKIEAVLFKIEDDVLLERIFNPPRGIFARVGGIGEGAGFGGGPGYQLLHRRRVASVSGHRQRGSIHVGEWSLCGGVRAAPRFSTGGLLRHRSG
jgi:hypothetical protein